MQMKAGVPVPVEEVPTARVSVTSTTTTTSGWAQCPGKGNRQLSVGGCSEPGSSPWMPGRKFSMPSTYMEEDKSHLNYNKENTDKLNQVLEHVSALKNDEKSNQILEVVKNHDDKLQSVEEKAKSTEEKVQTINDKMLEIERRAHQDREHRDMEREIGVLKSQNETLQKEKEAAVGDLDKANTAKYQMTREIKGLQEAKNVLEQDIARAYKEKAALEETLHYEQSQKQQQQHQQQQLQQQQRHSADEQCKVLQKANADLEKEVSVIKVQKQSLQKQLDQKETGKRDLERAKQELERAQQEKRAIEESFKQEKQRLSEEKKGLEKMCRDFRKEIEENTRAQQHQVQADVSGLKHQNQQLEHEKHQLEQQVADYDRELQALQLRFQKFEKENGSLHRQQQDHARSLRDFELRCRRAEDKASMLATPGEIMRKVREAAPLEGEVNRLTHKNTSLTTEVEALTQHLKVFQKYMTPEAISMAQRELQVAT